MKRRQFLKLLSLIPIFPKISMELLKALSSKKAGEIVRFKQPTNMTYVTTSLTVSKSIQKGDLVALVGNRVVRAHGELGRIVGVMTEQGIQTQGIPQVNVKEK